MIVTFDLAEEKFRGHLAPPPLPPKNKWYYNRIGVLDGLLYFVVWLVVGLFEYYDVWLLRKKDGDHDMKEQREEHQSWGWKKEFRIEKSELVVVTKTGGALTYTKFTNYIEIFDTKGSTSKKIVDFKKQWICEACPHKNSLVSLKELGEEDTKMMESIEIEETENHDQPSFTGR